MIMTFAKMTSPLQTLQRILLLDRAKQISVNNYFQVNTDHDGSGCLEQG
jgi:hypothetical protein